MPCTQSQGLNIYYEVEGQGPPLLLAHGLLGSVDLWRDTGYIDQLKDEATVIAFDARGHGRSEKPHVPEAYDYQLMAGDVAAVMDALALDRAHYWGYSMGGLIGFVMASRFPDRLHSLVLGGATPKRTPKPPKPNPAVELWRLGLVEGAEAVARRIEELVGPVSGPFRRCLQSVDFEAMVAYAQCPRSSLEREASGIDAPCLIYAGDEDKEAHQYGEQAAHALPNARFLSLPGRNHHTASDDAGQLVPEVLTFVKHLRTRKHLK